MQEGQAGGYNDAYDYGGIGTTLSGEFMQMPPVRKTGLAKDVDSAEAAGAARDEDFEDMTEMDVLENVKGFALW